MLDIRAEMDRDGAVRLDDGNVWDISKYLKAHHIAVGIPIYQDPTRSRGQISDAIQDHQARAPRGVPGGRGKAQARVANEQRATLTLQTTTGKSYIRSKPHNTTGTSR
jgi:hypothetical protein